jgi:hypothetical protein
MTSPENQDLIFVCRLVGQNDVRCQYSVTKRNFYKDKVPVLNWFNTTPWRRIGVSGCIDPHLLELGTSYTWVVSFMPPAALPPEKEPLRYSLYRRLCGPKSRSGKRGEEKILDTTGIRTPTPPVVQPVASRYTGSLKFYKPTLLFIY